MLRSLASVLACLTVSGVVYCAPGQIILRPTTQQSGLERPLQLPPAVARRLTWPVTRAEAVGVMLSSQEMCSAARRALPTGLRLEDLPTAFASGPMPVPQLPRVDDASVAARQPDTGRVDDGPPRSIGDLNWEGGVFIPPLQAPPDYTTVRNTYQCADMLLHGVSVHSVMFRDSDDVTYHLRGDSRAEIKLNLPDGPGVYLLSFNLWYLARGSWDPARIRISATSSAGTAELPFSLAPETEAYRVCRPLVALLEVGRGQAPLNPGAAWPLERTMVLIACDWPDGGAGSAFGGLTVTRL